MVFAVFSIQVDFAVAVGCRAMCVVSILRV